MGDGHERGEKPAQPLRRQVFLANRRGRHHARDSPAHGHPVRNFAEIGVGSGLENNTLILLASGWRGFWIGDEDLRFDHRINPKRLAFIKARVTSENVVGLMQRGFENMATNELDVLGLDLDGNDY